MRISEFSKVIPLPYTKLMVYFKGQSGTQNLLDLRRYYGLLPYLLLLLLSRSEGQNCGRDGRDV